MSCFVFMKTLSCENQDWHNYVFLTRLNKTLSLSFVCMCNTRNYIPFLFVFKDMGILIDTNCLPGVPTDMSILTPVAYIAWSIINLHTLLLAPMEFKQRPQKRAGTHTYAFYVSSKITSPDFHVRREVVEGFDWGDRVPFSDLKHFWLTLPFLLVVHIMRQIICIVLA